MTNKVTWQGTPVTCLQDMPADQDNDNYIIGQIFHNNLKDRYQ